MDINNLKKASFMVILGLSLGSASSASEASPSNGAKRKLEASEPGDSKRRRITLSSSSGENKEVGEDKFTVAVVGLGHVGARTVQELITGKNKDVASDLLLLSRSFEKAESLIDDTLPGFEGPRITPVKDFYQLAKADVIVISAGVHRAISRDELLEENKPIIRNIIDGLNRVEGKNQNAIVIIAANPVEDLSQYALFRARRSNYLNNPETQIIGSGTSVDTVRLHHVLWKKGYDINAIQDGYVFGEHGDKQFAAWDSMKINGEPISNFLNQENQLATENEAKNLGYKIVHNMKHSMTTVAFCLTNICKSIKEGGTTPVSVYDPSHNVYLSLLTKLGRSGVQQIVDYPFSNQEKERLQACITARKETLAKLI